MKFRGFFVCRGAAVVENGCLEAACLLECWQLRMETHEHEGLWPVFRPILRRYVRPVRFWVAMGVVAGMVAAALSGFGLPFMTQYVFPVIFGEQPAPEWLSGWLEDVLPPDVSLAQVTLWAAAFLVPLVMSLRGLAGYFNSYLLTKAGMLVLNQMRADVFARLQWLSFSFHDRHSRGKLMTTVLQFTQSLQQQIISVMNDLVIQPLTLLAAAGYLVYTALTNHESAILLGNLLLTVGCIPLVRFVGKRLVKQARMALSGMGVITSTVEETFNAQREVRAFNLQKRQVNLLQEVIRHYNRILLRMSAWQQGISPTIEFVSALALSYSLYRSCSGGLTLEQFSAIAFAFYFCYTPFKTLSAMSTQFVVMAEYVRAINEVLEAEDETPEPVVPKSLPHPAPGAVDFDHVSFSYTPDAPVLRDVDVHVPAGQIVALVGPSGSGKTTFINLICRFYDVQEGSVRIDGVDVRELSRAERTKAIGLVSQFAALFRGSIRENIRVGHPGATDEEVQRAGDRARVTEFTESLPQGYGYELSEGGGGLSGGQRQRVSVARAFLRNAPILILDEATSALDMRSEAYIQASLEELATGHTTFIIAHRFSTIRMAQRILVFEAGRVIADGTHQQLYETCTLYRHLYDEQVSREKDETNEDKEAPTC